MDIWICLYIYLHCIPYGIIVIYVICVEIMFKYTFWSSIIQNESSTILLHNITCVHKTPYYMRLTGKVSKIC